MLISLGKMIKYFMMQQIRLLTQFEIHYIANKILSDPTNSAQVFEWYDGYQNSDPDYYNHGE